MREYGFNEVGKWVLNDRVKSGVTFELNSLTDERVVYAFVVDGVPKYIGICEKGSTTFAERMNRYKSRQGGNGNRESTNQRIVRRIKECLIANQSVHIFAVRPDVVYNFVDLIVDLVKGLENPLIAKFKQELEWNK